MTTPQIATGAPAALIGLMCAASLALAVVPTGAAAATQTARLIENCQQKVTQAGAKFLDKELQGLTRCVTGISKCLQTKAGAAKCLTQANKKCSRTAAALTRAVGTFAIRIEKKCGEKLTPETLLGDAGLGYGRIAPGCRTDFALDPTVQPPTDASGDVRRCVAGANSGAFCTADSACPESTCVEAPSDLTLCLTLEHARAAEQLFDLAAPRARELIERAGAETPALFELPERPGCAGCAVTVPGDAAEAVQQCVQTLATAGQTFVTRAAASVMACAEAAFACTRGTPKDPVACRNKAAQICAKATAKLSDPEKGARAVLDRALAAACGETAIPFATLRGVSAANLDVLACECENVGVPALATVGDYARCLRQQHECQLAELARVVAPQLENALGDVLGDASATPLQQVLCQPFGATAATVGGERAAAAATISPRLLQFIRAAISLQSFDRARYRAGGAPVANRNAAASILAVARRARIAPGGVDPVTVRYQRGGSIVGAGALVTAAAAAAPSERTLVIRVRRADGTLVDDFLELPLPPDPPEGETNEACDLETCTIEFVVQYQPELRACGFDLDFTIVTDGAADASEVVGETPVVKLPGVPFLVKDINTRPGGLGPQASANVSGSVFFAISDGQHGEELWKSDGTATGTVLVADIAPGGVDSSPEQLTNVDGTLFFVADDGVSGRELWKSDGTAAGTVRVADLTPGSFPRTFVSELTNVNGTLFFIFFDYVTGHRELWRSDGTAVGTTRVGNLTRVLQLASLNGMIFLVNDSEQILDAEQLWKSDGTPAGTVFVATLTNDFGVTDLTNVDGALYIVGPRCLERSDGTAENTTVVKCDLGERPELAGVDGRILFVDQDELWTGDGTPAGTVRLTFGRILPNDLTSVNGEVLFTAIDDSGRELWKSDGTVAGTVRVTDLNPGPADAFFGGEFPSVAAGRDLMKVNDTLFFIANDGVSGFELWKSDGTATGTALVKDIKPGAGGSTRPISDPALLNVNGALFLRADDGATGPELWRSDGTDAGTFRIADIDPGTGRALPRLPGFVHRVFDAGIPELCDLGSRSSVSWLSISRNRPNRRSSRVRPTVASSSRRMTEAPGRSSGRPTAPPSAHLP